jgi:hypothetical protein
MYKIQGHAQQFSLPIINIVISPLYTDLMQRNNPQTKLAILQFKSSVQQTEDVCFNFYYCPLHSPGHV